MSTNQHEVIIKLNDQATAGLKKMKWETDSVADSFMSMWKKVLWAYWAFEAFKGFVSLTSGVENAKIWFETLLWSQEKALQMLRDIDEFASKTPFQKTTLTPLVQQMLGMWFAAEKTLPILNVLGDSMAALGRGDADLQGVVLALWQIQTKWKISAEELMQLAERGLPVYQILEKQLGLTKKQLADIWSSGISAEKGIAALMTGLNEKFWGNMAKMAQTLTGQWSNLMDNMKSLVGNSWQFLSDKIKGFLTNINAWFEKNRADITDVFNALFTYSADILDTIGWILWVFWDIYASVMDAIVGYTQDSGKSQASVWKEVFMFIANSVAAAGAVISIFIRGLAAWLWVAWNVVQVAAQAIVSGVMSLVAGAFWPIEKLLNGVIHGINLVRSVLWMTALDTIHFSENLFGAAMDSMKATAEESWKDISAVLTQANEWMTKDIQNAATKIETNFAKLNGSMSTTKTNTSDLTSRIQWTIAGFKDMWDAGSVGGGKAWSWAKWAKEELKKMQTQAEDAAKKIIDWYEKTKKEIDDARAKIKEITWEWVKYKQEWVKAVSEVNAAIKKLADETSKVKLDIQTEWNTDLAQRSVEIKKRLLDIEKETASARSDMSKDTTIDPDKLQRLTDLQTEQNSLTQEQEFIQSKVDQIILKQVESYDAMNKAQQIVFDNTKKMDEEMKKKQEEMTILMEKKAILEAQANQKSISDTRFKLQEENGVVKAFYKDTAGAMVEIKDQENINLAISIQEKQAQLKKEYDDENQILKKKLSLQKSHLEDLKIAYAAYHTNLKEETSKMSLDLIAKYNSVAASLREVIALQRSAGMWSSWWSTWTRAFWGPVSSGEPYLVGERGPELFVPSTSWSIVSNDKMWGWQSVTINFGGVTVRNDSDIREIVSQVKDALVRDTQLYRQGLA